MAQTHFENLIEGERRQAVEAMISIPNGDSHRHAELKGLIRGLDLSLIAFRKAARTDASEGDL